ncbi:hypothetical protein PR202_ga10509 [Eleusine coracana subsp. coracana]|uniref:Uncharacterized protein n=1 Tax=Eleusine coracana subsp. coracana TaxID=191504 RepID=A0AAV5C6X5_ELECO|nr:hypothetical protein PR202_ga10509 [Eleusine coracana subsp. coracana]
MTTFATTTKLGHIVLKFRLLIDGIQFKSVAPSGQIVWPKLRVSTQVGLMHKTR